MKNFLKSLISLFSFALLTACSASEPPIGLELAEYDGAYVVTQEGRYLPLEVKDTATTRIVYSRNGKVSYSQMLNAKDRYYTLSNETNASLKAEYFKGVFVKGDYKFNLFSLHPLEEKNLQKEGNELLFENKGAADYGVPFYLPGKHIELRKRSADEENGYYFEVLSPLDSGKYVGWIGRDFWVFEIAGSDEIPTSDNQDK